MNRDEKAQMVDELRGRFGNSPLVILANFQGSTPLQMDAIRRKLEPVGVHFRVVKNSLAKRAIAGTELEPLAKHFKGNTGVAFSGEDAQATAKAFKELVKDNDKLSVRVGYFDGAMLDGAGVIAVSDLPGKDQLRAQLLATLVAAPRQVLGVLQAPGRDLVYLLSNHAAALEKKD